MPNFSHHRKSYNGVGSIFNDCVVKRISRISLTCIAGLNGVGAVEAKGGAVRARCVDVLARVLGVVFCVFFSSTAVANQQVTITTFCKWDTNEILWGGDGNAAWNVLQLEIRGSFLYSYVLRVNGRLLGLDIEIADNDSLQNVLDRLATNPVPDMKYVNWGGDWSNNITPYYPTGHVFLDADGKPNGVMLNNGGDLSTIPLNQVGEGYISDPFVLDGTTGTMQVHYINPDLGWSSTFVPNWNGGIDSGSSPTTSTGFFNPQSSNFGGGDTPFVFPTVNTTGGSSGGGGVDSPPVVDIPAYNVTDSSGNTFPVFDYRNILSSIGGVLQSHAIQNHDDFSTVNENLRKVLEIEDGGELQVSSTDDTEYTVDFSESDQALEDVSRWGFDFGFDNNPIGEVFTAIVGNPPTSFGSSDQVWDINFKITPDIEVKSTFKLSDWFPRVFRSCILMMATIVFSISSAKTIGEAFS